MSNQMWSTQTCTNKSIFSLSFLAIICRCRLGMERGLVGAVSDLDSSAADNPEFSIWSVACTKLGTSSLHQLSSTFPRHPTEPPEPCTGGHGQPQPAGHGHTGHPLTAAMPWRWPALLPQQPGSRTVRAWARPAETECTKPAAAHARTKSMSFAQDFEISQVSRNILDMTCPRMRKPRIVQTHGKTHGYVKLTK